MTDTIQYFREEVMPVLRRHGEQLGEINEHLARQNERIAHAEERSKAHSGRLDEHGTALSQARASIAALKATITTVDRFRNDQIDTVRCQQRTQREKLWSLAVELAKLAGAGGATALAIEIIKSLK
jgi:chromosome segregation ATPase